MILPFNQNILKDFLESRDNREFLKAFILILYIEKKQIPVLKSSTFTSLSLGFLGILDNESRENIREIIFERLKSRVNRWEEEIIRNSDIVNNNLRIRDGIKNRIKEEIYNKISEALFGKRLRELVDEINNWKNRNINNIKNSLEKINLVTSRINSNNLERLIRDLRIEESDLKKVLKRFLILSLANDKFIDSIRENLEYLINLLRNIEKEIKKGVINYDEVVLGCKNKDIVKDRAKYFIIGALIRNLKNPNLTLKYLLLDYYLLLCLDNFTPVLRLVYFDWLKYCK